MDQDSTFMSSIMNYLFKKLNIKIKTVAPYNHQLLQAEHGIKSLSTILTKYLTSQGQMWPKCWLLATFAYNTCNTPNLGNFSPYKLVFSKLSDDKLINQMSCKYVRRVICLILIINTKCQQGC